tara:strand:- start:79020 stop:79202 length:183 start_codon:yes stop_codon:yes gene_type:complete
LIIRFILGISILVPFGFRNLHYPDVSVIRQLWLLLLHQTDVLMVVVMLPGNIVLQKFLSF